MSGARVHIPLTAEQQRVGSLMSAFAYTLFEDGPLVPVQVRGPKGEIEGVGLVDTGCGISVVHAPVVESLGCRHVKSQLLIGDVLAQCRFVYDGPSGRFRLEVV